MNDNRKTNSRRSTRLKNYDYSQPGYYFVTICTYEKKWLFGEIIDGQMHLNSVGTSYKQCGIHFPNVFRILHWTNTSYRDNDLDHIRQYITTNPAGWSNDSLNIKEGIAS